MHYSHYLHSRYFSYLRFARTMEEILGQSKVFAGFRVTIKPIAKELKLKETERVVFVRNDNGEIVVRKMKP